MKAFGFTATLYALLIKVDVAWSYWTFSHLLVNGTETGYYKHVLNTKPGPIFPSNPWPPTPEFPKTAPFRVGEEGKKGWDYYDWKTQNFTCGREAFLSVDNTTVANVVAGEQLGFRTTKYYEYHPDFEPYQYPVIAPGPGSIWLSKVPNDNFESYKGEGDWFRVAYAGPKNNREWKLYLQNDFNFTLPKTTPPGKYLMRVEVINPSYRWLDVQYWVNCALVNVIGPGGGKPSGFAKFPGTYNETDEGIWVPLQQYYQGLPSNQMRLLEYKPPGPELWTG